MFNEEPFLRRTYLFMGCGNGVATNSLAAIKGNSSGFVKKASFLFHRYELVWKSASGLRGLL